MYFFRIPKAKNFIDTLVYRGGDALSAWAFAGLQALGLGLAGLGPGTQGQGTRRAAVRAYPR